MKNRLVSCSIISLILLVNFMNAQPNNAQVIKFNPEDDQSSTNPVLPKVQPYMPIAVPLPITTPTSPSVPSITTPLTKQEIDKQIANIKKTINGVNNINIIATTITAGVGATAVAATTAVAIALFLIAPYFPHYVAFEATGVTAISSATVIASGIISLIIAGALGTTSGAAVIALFGGLSATSILTALVEAKKLETLESTHPGTLTATQKTTLAQFNTMLKGNLGMAIAKGLQLKKIKNTLSTQALTQNPSLLTILGNAQKAQKLIGSYFNDIKKLVGLKIANQVYKKQKEALKKESSQHKILSAQRTKLDLKIAGLDLKFAFVPLQLSTLEKKINKIHTKYAGIEKMLATAAQEFIKESERIIAELSSTTK